MEEAMPPLTRVLPVLLVAMMATIGQTLAAWWILRQLTRRGNGGPSCALRWTVVAGSGLSLVAVVFGFLLGFTRFRLYFPGSWPDWERGLAMLWALLFFSCLAGLAVVQVLAPVFSHVFSHVFSRVFSRVSSKPGARPGRPHDPERRHFLKTAQAAVFAAPPAVLGYGMFIERHQLVLREQYVDIPGLPVGLDGLRLVQLTDIHLSPFVSRKMVERAVAMANETRAHVALVTGDLITGPQDPLDDCLRVLAGLRSDAGVYGCLGNHEVFGNAEDHAEREGARLGLRFLRHAAVPLRFGDATLNLAGVDYQNVRRPYLVGSEKLIVPGTFNVLLSHNPDVFRVAARQGYSLTVSGHTHGGQIRTEILSADLNPARFYTPYVDGMYRRGDAAIFVSRGIGTITVPARIGAPPEVALIRLRRV
jgi:predicted MPP superfamily phosphohydrolase